MREMVLNIVTPNGTCDPIPCDSIHLIVCDNANGKGGGSYGIRAGHLDALLSLDRGRIEAFCSGERILAGECGPGFATVEKNTVTVVVEKWNEMEEGR